MFGSIKALQTNKKNGKCHADESKFKTDKVCMQESKRKAQTLQTIQEYKSKNIKSYSIQVKKEREANERSRNIKSFKSNSEKNLPQT